MRPSDPLQDAASPAREAPFLAATAKVGDQPQGENVVAGMHADIANMKRMGETRVELTPVNKREQPGRL